MALIEYTLEGKINKVDVAIQRIKAFEPPDGYYLGFSGGKDSQVIERLAAMSGVKYEAHRAASLPDPPELVQFVRKYYPSCIDDTNGKTMWSIISKNTMPPTRVLRYCCKDLKECYGDGKLHLLGIRADEGTKRAKIHGVVSVFADKKEDRTRYFQDNPETAAIVTACYTKNKHTINPIIDWSTEDVWEFIKAEKMPYCGLYDEGFYRLGCIGCPMGNNAQRIMQFKRWPKYYEAYIRAFDRMILNRRNKNMSATSDIGNSGEDVMDWWLNEKNQNKQIEGQEEF